MIDHIKMKLASYLCNRTTKQHVSKLFDRKSAFAVFIIVSVILVIQFAISHTKTFSNVLDISSDVQLAPGFVLTEISNGSLQMPKHNNIHNAPNIYQFRGSWRNFSDVNCQMRDDFVLKTLVTPVHAYVYSYSSLLGVLISKSIAMWGKLSVDIVYKSLKQEPNTVFIDVGSNIGIYSIMAATLGHRVYAIDRASDNIEHLCASLKLNNVQRKVTLIYNAVSNEHTDVMLDRFPVNLGGIYDKEKFPIHNYEDKILGATIRLDDMLQIHNFRNVPVMIKLDIDTFEAHALKGATELFNVACVTHVLIEYRDASKLSEKSFFKMLHKNKLTLISEQNNKHFRQVTDRPRTMLWKRLSPCL